MGKNAHTAAEDFQLLSDFVKAECQNRLRAYSAQPRDAAEHFETENEALSGAYAYRQLFELVQNAADAILESGEPSGRIEVVLQGDRLETANTGAPLNEDGIVALLNARSSAKRGAQIGRFGIGFKSLLKLGGKVDFYSRPVGLRFEPEACRSAIRKHLGLTDVSRAPGMRLALPLDPLAATSPLRPGEALEWATSVVVADISDGPTRDRIGLEIEAFPAEFLLFLPVEIDLVLRIKGGAVRHVKKRLEGNVAYIEDGSSETRWRMFETGVRVDGSEARADATHVQARDVIPLAWAMPMEGREQAGRFWAFFPTETQTHVPGILNAPWKLNSDRTNLVRGAYNEAIMEAAADLVASSLPLLSSDGDMGASVAAFPRRLERQDDISVPLVKALWDRILASPSLPDANGKLHLPQALARHPVEDREVAAAWGLAASRGEKACFLHPDCYAHKYRISRLDTLETEARKRGIALHPKPPLADWIELLAATGLDAARRCLEFTAGLDAQKKRLGIGYIPAASIIPAADGGLCKPADVAIPETSRLLPGIRLVASEIAADPTCRAILVDVLHVTVLAEDDWHLILHQAFERATGDDTTEAWEGFWECLATAPEEDATGFINEAGARDLKFKDQAGGFSAREMLVAGRDPLDAPPNYLLDLDYHEAHRYRLPAGTFSIYSPGWVDVLLAEADFAGYLPAVQQAAYQEILQRSTSGKPQPSMIVARGAGSARTVKMPAPWQLLGVLPPEPAARLTVHLLDEIAASAQFVSPLTFEHKTRRDTYPVVTAPHPVSWIISRHGKVMLGDLVVPIRTIDANWAGLLSSAKLAHFDFLASFLDDRDCRSDLAGKMAWPKAPMLLPAPGVFWSAALAALRASPCPPVILREAWDIAAVYGVAPAWVPSETATKAISEAYITTDPSTLHGLPDGEIILLPAVTATVWEKAGATLVSGSTGATRFETELTVPGPLARLFPELLAFPELEGLAGAQHASWVTGLAKEAGPVRSMPALAWSSDGVLLIDRGKFETLGWTGFAPVLLDALTVKAGSGLDTGALQVALVGQRKRDTRNAVRAYISVEDKLLAAVGGMPAALLRSLPPATQRAVPDDTPAHQVASLALAVHGPGILRKLAPEMEATGIEPPERWTGEAAMEFVLDLGFPKEFAAGLQSRRAASVEVNGPIPLPPLHDYQRGIVEDLGKLLTSGPGRRRAIVSLPTGGGKTRVAGEAVVRLVLNGKANRTALWIAQTEELCEQAVQCFEELWANIGTPYDSLRIARLWGGQKNPPPPEQDGPVVVVASIQTLASRFSRKELDWLKAAGVVVIDECHHAITTSYSELFRWLDLQIGNERARDREPPVIGLSATPWRGFSDEESERLAARFDRRWLPADQEGLHELLSQQGVLASRTYSPIRYDREVTLTDAERQQFEKFNELPDSVTARIGEDEDRNDLIVDAVVGSGAQSVLLFANSVSHAQHLAARLHLAGCPAAAVSGETDKLSRRHFTNLFRTGALKAICNHSVLTTGFDAPKADMVFISRPVFSPVLYMQMVGRGLRGPANGGTAHCEIMTVEDNILNFKDQLAFHFCRRFFDGAGGQAEG